MAKSEKTWLKRGLILLVITLGLVIAWVISYQTQPRIPELTFDANTESAEVKTEEEVTRLPPPIQQEEAIVERGPVSSAEIAQKAQDAGETAEQFLEEPNTVTELRSSILDGPYGVMPIEVLVSETLKTRGPRRREMQLAMVMRKSEALPLVLDRLQQGSRKEKISAIKLVSSVQWKETALIITNLVSDIDEPEIVRVGACYALGELGIAESAPLLLDQLAETDSIQIKRASLLSLGNLKDPDTTSAIEPYREDADDFVRLYAEVALSKMGKLQDGPGAAIDLSLSEDWQLRSEAIRALGAIGGDDALQRLEEIATTHPLPGVRDAAERAIEKAKLVGMPRAQALNYIRSKMKEGDEEIQAWAMKVAAKEFGEDGLNIVREKAEEAGAMGQAAAFYYIAHREARKSIKPRERTKDVK